MPRLKTSPTQELIGVKHEFEHELTVERITVQVSNVSDARETLQQKLTTIVAVMSQSEEIRTLAELNQLEKSFALECKKLKDLLGLPRGDSDESGRADENVKHYDGPEASGARWFEEMMDVDETEALSAEKIVKKAYGTKIEDAAKRLNWSDKKKQFVLAAAERRMTASKGWYPDGLWIETMAWKEDL